MSLLGYSIILRSMQVLWNRKRFARASCGRLGRQKFRPSWLRCGRLIRPRWSFPLPPF